MKKTKICSLLLAASMMLSVAACSKDKDDDETTAAPDVTAAIESESEAEATDATGSESETEPTDATDPTEPTDATQPAESADDTLTSDENSELGYNETFELDAETQLKANIFVSNFVEANFPGYMSSFDVSTVNIEKLLDFVFFHLKINAYQELGYEQRGELGYTTFTVEQATDVIGRYICYLFTEEDCASLPTPPETLSDMGQGPYYADGKIYYISGDGERFFSLGIVDRAELNPTGTVTLYYTAYSLDYEVYESLDDAGVQAYYALTPDQAAADPALTPSYSAVAVCSVGQAGSYSIYSIEVVEEF